MCLVVRKNEKEIFLMVSSINGGDIGVEDSGVGEEVEIFSTDLNSTFF